MALRLSAVLTQLHGFHFGAGSHPAGPESKQGQLVFALSMDKIY